MTVGAGNVQAEARRARYAALAEAARRHASAAVVTGHTATDQAETVLMNLVRGAGLRGLGGMPPRRPLSAGVSLVRPLLWATRAEVEAEARARGWTWRDDPGNAGDRFQRNRIRRSVLPLLDAEGGPGTAARVARAADAARAALAVVPALLDAHGAGGRLSPRRVPPAPPERPAGGVGRGAEAVGPRRPALLGPRRSGRRAPGRARRPARRGGGRGRLARARRARARDAARCVRRRRRRGGGAARQRDVLHGVPGRGAVRVRRRPARGGRRRRPGAAPARHPPRGAMGTGSGRSGWRGAGSSPTSSPTRRSRRRSAGPCPSSRAGAGCCGSSATGWRRPSP